ncbi:hypothetical protein [Tessaracoccus sp.]
MGNYRDARQFVESFFDGDATRAILTIGAACGVAVAYQNRTTFECRLGRDMTDEEFEGLDLDSFDESLDMNGLVSEAIADWMDKTLAAADISNDDDLDEPEREHRYNTAPYCAKCAGPCRMPHPGGNEFACHLCGSRAFLTSTEIAHHMGVGGTFDDIDADHTAVNIPG